MERTVKIMVNNEREKIKLNLLTTAGVVDIFNLKHKRCILLKGNID